MVYPWDSGDEYKGTLMKRLALVTMIVTVLCGSYQAQGFDKLQGIAASTKTAVIGGLDRSKTAVVSAYQQLRPTWGKAQVAAATKNVAQSAKNTTNAVAASSASKLQAVKQFAAQHAQTVLDRTKNSAVRMQSLAQAGLVRIHAMPTNAKIAALVGGIAALGAGAYYWLTSKPATDKQA